MQKQKPKKLSRKEVEQLLEDNSYTKDAELSGIGAGEAFELASGQLMLRFEDGKGMLYESKAALQQLVKNIESKGRVEDPVAQMLPPQQEFIDQVPALLAQLPELLQIDAALLNKTEESLNEVEKAIKKIGFKKILQPQYMAPLTAYVGEVISAATNGRWEVFNDEYNVVSEPIIRDKANRVYQPFNLVYKELDLGRSGSIRGAVNGTLHPFY